MDQHGIKRHLSCLLDAAEHHAHNPERNDIISGHESIGGIKYFISSVSSGHPSVENGYSAELEPGIQSIGILPHFLAAFWTEGFIFLCHSPVRRSHHTVKCRDLILPPELPGYTPVPDVFQPVEIGLVKMIGNKTGLSFFTALSIASVPPKASFLQTTVYSYLRLYRSSAAVARFLHYGRGPPLLHTRAPSRLQVFYDLFSHVSLNGPYYQHIFHTLSTPSHRLSSHVDHRKIVTQTDFKVI